MTKNNAFPETEYQNHRERTTNPSTRAYKKDVICCYKMFVMFVRTAPASDAVRHVPLARSTAATTGTSLSFCSRCTCIKTRCLPGFPNPSRIILMVSVDVKQH